MKLQAITYNEHDTPYIFFGSGGLQGGRTTDPDRFTLLKTFTKGYELKELAKMGRGNTQPPGYIVGVRK